LKEEVGSAPVAVAGRARVELGDGAVVIAAITSCTNTSNPSVMVAAGLLAKAAVERGLEVQPHVKTSLAPGSRVVTDYLKAAGLPGTRRHDLSREPLGTDRDGKPVMLSELWPSPELVARTVGEAVERQMYTREYERIFDGDENWKKMDSPTGASFDWDAGSTY